MAYIATQLEGGATFHQGSTAAPYLGALGTAGWPTQGPYAEGRLSWEFAQDASIRMSGDVGLGAQLTFGPWTYVVSGRPLRWGGAVVLPATVAWAGACPAFVAAARAEWASAPAFLRLAAELEALGAPRSLVGRSLAAARDEVRHAADCMVMAGAAIFLSPIPRFPPRVRPRRDWVALLAAESEMDGVVGEGAGADALAAQASACQHDGPARRLARMAREERAHATLAKDIVVWCRGELA